MISATEHPAVRQTYAAYTNQGFLLREVSAVAALRLQGMDNDKLRVRVQRDDLFQLASSSSRKTILSAALKRLEGAPPELLTFLAEGSLDLRRLTNLYLFLLQHRLLREFIAEVVLEELRRFSRNVPPAEIGSFMQHKVEQVQEVAGWSEATRKKSRSNLIAVCAQADLLGAGSVITGSAGLLIQPQVIPPPLRSELTHAGRREFLTLLLDQEAV